MKPLPRIALLVLLGILVAASVGLRGCWDITKPVPWVADEHARDSSAIAPAAR